MDTIYLIFQEDRDLIQEVVSGKTLVDCLIPSISP